MNCEYSTTSHSVYYPYYRCITAVCTHKDTLFFADKEGAIYRVEGDNKKLVLKDRGASYTHLIFLNGVLWIFKKTPGRSSIQRWDLTSNYQLSYMTISDSPPKDICIWGVSVAVLLKKPYVLIAESTGLTHQMSPPEISIFPPTCLTVWEDKLCIGHKSTVYIYTDKNKIIKRLDYKLSNDDYAIEHMTRPGYYEIEHMAVYGEFLYARSTMTIVKYDREGKSTLIYENKYEKFDRMTARAKGLAIFDRQIAYSFGNVLYNFESLENSQKVPILLGNLFYWLDCVWTIPDQDSKGLIGWKFTRPWSQKLHSSFSKRLRDSIKTLVILHRSKKLPASNIPIEILNLIIEIFVVQWAPSCFIEWTDESYPLSTKRRTEDFFSV